MSKAKPTEAWAIETPRNYIRVSTVGTTERESWWGLTDSEGDLVSPMIISKYAEMKTKQGFRCIRVTITPAASSVGEGE